MIRRIQTEVGHRAGTSISATPSGSLRGKLAALAYHYPPEMPRTVPGSFDSRAVADETLDLGQPEALAVEFTGLRPGATFAVETLTRGHGDVMAAWHALGAPEPLSREQTQHVRAAALATHRETVTVDATGRLRLARDLASWSVVLISES